MSTSSIPAAIDGILALLRAASGLRGVEIIDGEPTTNTPKDFVTIGFAQDGGDVVTGFQGILGMGNVLREEQFDIACRASSWNGGTNFKTVRDRAFALFGVVEDTLRAASTINDAVTFAQIAPISYAQYQTDQGATADLDFSISVHTARF